MGEGLEEIQGLFGEFLDESRELLDALARDLVELERRPDDRELVHRIFRAAHSLKGNAGFMGLGSLATLAHSMENVLGRVRNGSLDGDSALLDLLFRGLDQGRALLAAAAPGADPGPDADLEALLARLETLNRSAAGAPGAGAPEAPGATSDSSPSSSVDDSDLPPRSAAGEGGGVAAGVSPGSPPARPAAPAQGGAPRRQESDTIRVSTARLDRLVNLVGELMATRSQVANIARTVRQRRLDDAAGALTRLADQLQEEVLSVRMVPIRTLFQKFHRLVRDTGREAGKAVELVLAGEETELDKAIIESIHDPLVHLVRNAIGHGLEPAEARVAAGKPAAGRLSLSAYHAQHQVVVEVADDGRGIDEAAVRRRAVEAELIVASESDGSLGPDLVRRLIFSPGFSTAGQVDSLSGRGVGLDVVRTAIETLGGSVALESEPGRGATFTLRVPLTLAMIQIFLARVGDRLYGLPLPVVEETIRVVPTRLEVVGRQRLHLLRGQAVPIVPLADAFDAGDAPEEADESLRPVIVVRHDERRIGLLVDEVCGKDKTVLKPLGPYLARLPTPLRGISGASLLGSGELVLIVDVAGLFGMIAEDATETGRAVAR
jgi:two-component system chemotaxis sensor kinase CheA